VPLRPCAQPGCAQLVKAGRCAAHKAKAQASLTQARVRADEARPPSNQRGYDSAWAAVRRQYLGGHPTCVVCGARATEVDHITSIREAPHLRLHWSNLRALCKPCHSRRTGRDQGFGRARTIASPVPHHIPCQPATVRGSLYGPNDEGEAVKITASDPKGELT
jgi:5-methylcytosine-specific restriction protein A